MPTTYDSIASTTLSVASNTITFSSIPQTFTDLRLIVTGTVTNATGQPYGIIRLNGISSSIYSQSIIAGSGTGVTTTRYTTSSAFPGIVCNTAGYTTTTPFFIDAQVFSYTSGLNKFLQVRTNNDTNGTGFLYTGIEAIAGQFASAAAITSVSFISSSQQFAIGTTASLYGILRA